MKKHLLIFGYGETAKSLARILNPEEWEIFGTSRSQTHDDACRIIKFDEQSIAKILPQSTHLLISIPPNDEGDVTLNRFQELLTKHKIIKWIGYLSSTGVYGNHDGNWVDEESQTNPTNTRSINRLLAENQWKKFTQEQNIPLNIFRLAGIYGENSNPLINIKAKSINKKNQVFSRIHTSDIAQTIQAALNTPYSNEIYNIADDYPCSSIEVNNYAAHLLDMPTPPIIDFSIADLSVMAKSFYQDNKRVSNKKIKERLKVKLNFPTYKDGLTHILKMMKV